MSQLASFMDLRPWYVNACLPSLAMFCCPQQQCKTPMQIIPWHSMLALATRNEQGRESPWVQLLKLFFQVYTCRNVGLCIYLVQKICWLHQFWSEGIKADVGSLLVPVKSLRQCIIPPPDWVMQCMGAYCLLEVSSQYLCEVPVRWWGKEGRRIERQTFTAGWEWVEFSSYVKPQLVLYRYHFLPILLIPILHLSILADTNTGDPWAVNKIVSTKNKKFFSAGSTIMAQIE